ncbi:MAG: acetate--CoA ligase family protein [Deltaproteobacteria bacterium]|nr:acetate--CoA ligase family protein [Deltaproteobacteria bacterium]
MDTTTRRNHRQNLTPLLNPDSVAIVGISQPERFGGILAQNVSEFGYAGTIYGVNPRYDSLYDRPCYASLRDLPERPDLAILAVPNSGLVASLEEVAECGIPAAVIFASAYSEPAEGELSLKDQLGNIARENDIALCGPNGMGFVAPCCRLAVSGYRVNMDTPTGNVAMICHSGSVWEAFLQNQRGVNFNYIISAGSESATTLSDYMQFALENESTRVIGLFLETVRDPETFTAALVEAAERDVPVVALKTGRSERGAQLARAHSGALAGEDGAYEALFEHYGVRRVRSPDELLDTLELFATGMRTKTQFVSAILDSGGQRALMVDLGESEGVEFTPIAEETQQKLSEVLEPGLDPVNPLDAWGTGNGADDIYAKGIQALDADPSTGITLLAVDLPPMDDHDSWYSTIVSSLLGSLRNPLAVLAHLSDGTSTKQAGELRAMDVPVLMGTENGLRATRHIVEYSAFQRSHAANANAQPPRTASPENLAELRERLRGASGAIGEHDSKQLLAAYGLTTTREILTKTLAETLSAGDEIGYPIALKTSADLHKTERGGVRLGIANRDELSEAYSDFEKRLGADVLVQQMIPQGTELILGVVNDPQFGPMLTLGTGGIFVEVLKDVSMLTVPTTPDAVRKVLMRLRGAALLKGARGKAPADIDAIVDAVMGLSALAEDLGESISEIDVNPLVALPDRAVVVDALIIPREAN